MEGRALELRRRKQRLLVTLLALRPGEVVSTDRLVDEIWGSRPPKSALGSLQNLVSELRKTLGSEVVRTQGGGYGLGIEPEHVDLYRFEALVAEGRRAQMANRRAERLREGLGLWRGPPLAEFAFEPFAQVEITRLQELRLAAREELVEAELELGSHATLIDELEALVAQHPLRERLRAQLMLALYRSGRQTDALAVFQDARRELRDDLGLEPGDELRRLQQAILNHDSSLWPQGSLPVPEARRILDFRLLGPVEVRAGGQLLRLGNTKQRALLAFLLLNANRVVSRNALIDALWGEDPPTTAATAVHGYVSSLRRSIGTNRIETRSPGYLLNAAPEELDLATFERLYDEARALEPGNARARLEDALRLWRGVPLADLDAVPFATVERLRLEELRLSAIEDRADAYLALDRHAELVSELQTLVREHPLRERLRGQLMLALYRSGRQAEALEVYRHGRYLLAEELGLQPGEGLKRLELAILAQDPALHGADAPATRRELPDTQRPRVDELSGRRLLRWRNVGAAFAATVLAAVAAGIYFALPTSETGITVIPNSVAIVDARTNQVIHDVAVGRSPVAIAFGEGAVWVANAGDGTVSRINPNTMKEIRVLRVATDIRDLTTGFGSVWVANGKDGTLSRIDPHQDKITTLRLGREVEATSPVRWVAAGAGAVWAIRGNTIVEINPAANRVVAKINIPSPTGLTAGLGAAWVVTDDHRLLQIVRRRKDAHKVTEMVSFTDHALAPTVGAGSIWFIVRRGTGEIWRIDPHTGAPSIIPNAGRHPLDLAVDDTTESIWAVDSTGAVVRVNPNIELTVAEIRTAATIQSAIAVGGGAVWVAVQE